MAGIELEDDKLELKDGNLDRGPIIENDELVTILENNGVVHKLKDDDDELEDDELDHGPMEPGQET